MRTKHCMEFSGIAALSDLQEAEWMGLFSEMENKQDEFLEKEHLFRSADYKWPRDALHNWSRILEYPYVYHHLSELKKKQGSDQDLLVADIGSGVTFFPFEVARLGFDITCVDIDPVVERDLLAARDTISTKDGSMSVALIDGVLLPFEDASLDVVYSISVIEHIPDFEGIINEIFRVLKPGGLFFITYDLDLRGDSELGIDEFNSLRDQINDRFNSVLVQRTVHPRDILTSWNSPYRLAKSSVAHTLKYAAKRALKPLVSFGHTEIGPVLGPVHLAVYSGCYTKK